MASVSLRSKSSLINAISKRYASAAASQSKEAKQQASLPKEPLRVTKLDNGIVVASLENNSPVTRVAAVINASARDESHQEAGASHALRVYSSLATRNFSLFGVSRNLDQIGADVSVSSSREQTTYLLQGTRNNIARGVDIVGDIVSKPELRFWEINDAHNRFELELNVYDESPELKVVELAHKAAFRSALNNSLYAPRFNVHNLNSDVLQAFRNKNFTANRLTLVGVGISHDDLIRHASLFRLPSGTGAPRQPAKYLGSEIREDNNSSIVHAILASEGVSASSKSQLASSIASHAFGAQGGRIKYANGTSKIGKALSQLAKEPASVASFNANYTDAGLFGFHIIGNKNDIGNLVKGVFKEVQKAAKSGLSNEDIARAKNSLKASLSYSLESPLNQLHTIGLNAEQAHTQTNVEELFKSIDAVSANDVNAFVQKLTTGRPTLAAVGNLSHLPRVDELSA